MEGDVAVEAMGTAPIVSTTLTTGAAPRVVVIGFGFFFFAGGVTMKRSFTTGTRTCRVLASGRCAACAALAPRPRAGMLCAVGIFGTPSEGKPTPGTRSTGRRAGAADVANVEPGSVARRIAGSVYGVVNVSKPKIAKKIRAVRRLRPAKLSRSNSIAADGAAETALTDAMPPLSPPLVLPMPPRHHSVPPGTGRDRVTTLTGGK